MKIANRSVTVSTSTVRVVGYGQNQSFQFTFGFKTREEYLEFVKAWKAEYAQASKDQRELKKSRKGLAPGVANSINCSVHGMKPYLTAAIALRKAAKVEAQRQWKEQMAKVESETFNRAAYAAAHPVAA